MWIDDKAEDAKVFAAKANSGFNARKDIVKLGKTFHFQSRIFSDIFAVSKYLLPNISMVKQICMKYLW